MTLRTLAQQAMYFFSSSDFPVTKTALLELLAIWCISWVTKRNILRVGLGFHVPLDATLTSTLQATTADWRRAWEVHRMVGVGWKDQNFLVQRTRKSQAKHPCRKLSHPQIRDAADYRKGACACFRKCRASQLTISIHAYACMPSLESSHKTVMETFENEKGRQFTHKFAHPAYFDISECLNE
jgi:hypothetical protein